MTKLAIKTCPTCGSRKIRRVKRQIESNRGGHPFIAKNIEIEECPIAASGFSARKLLRKLRPNVPGAGRGPAAENPLK
jgi:predicted  nucleic acid-binding Zn-ribbon protein